MADLIELKVPDIGDFDEVEIIEVLVSAGDSVTKNQDIITLESDKAAMEIPSSFAGVIREVKVAVGEKVKKGSVIAMLEASDSSQPASAVETKEEVKSAPASTPAPAPVVEVASKPELVEIIPFAPDNKSAVKQAHASPSVRQFARELGVTLSSVSGSGEKGRITKQDVQNFVKQKVNAPAVSANTGSGIPPVPVINFEKFGEVETKELSRIKKISGKHLHACWLNIPHVTQFDDADITELEEFRKANKDMAAKQGVNLT
ncbi:MAG: E3 binding domain-containing protein, partial [Pseudomonadota bacterium]|nr:E3 binding domain-containing protein [Pseudomonadota bacterium]